MSGTYKRIDSRQPQTPKNVSPEAPFHFLSSQNDYSLNLSKKLLTKCSTANTNASSLHDINTFQEPIKLYNVSNAIFENHTLSVNARVTLKLEFSSKVLSSPLENQ